MGILSWIGGIVGFMAFGPLGALAGFVFGYLMEGGNTSQTTYTNGGGFGNDDFDNGSINTGQRNSFLFSLMVLSAHIIQADGKIMHSEMEFVRSFLRNNFGSAAEQQGNDILLRLFELRKQQDRESPYKWRDTIRQCCQQIASNTTRSERLQLLNLLVLIAQVDGNTPTSEVNALYEVAQMLGLSSSDVDSMLNLGRVEEPDSPSALEAAYKVLGVSPDATDAEVKAAYRKMALEHHPDRVGKLGDDVRKAAEKKFQEINAAKEIVYKARGL